MILIEKRRLYAKCYEKDNNITTTIAAGISAVFKITKKIMITPNFSVQSKFQGADDNMGTYMILKNDANYYEFGNGNLRLYFHH